MWRLLLTALGAALLGMCVTCSYAAPAQNSLDSSSHPLYTNRAYGFKVVLPPGLSYTRTVPPNPDHGLGIQIDHTKFWVDASYTDSSSTEEEAKRRSQGCRIEEKRSALLGNRPGIAMRLSCGANAYTGAYEESLVLVVYKGKDRSPVDYQIGVRTDGPRITSQDERTLGKLEAGFSFLK